MEPRDIEAVLARLASIESLLQHVLAELQSQRPVVDAVARPARVLRVVEHS